MSSTRRKAPWSSTHRPESKAARESSGTERCRTLCGAEAPVDAASLLLGESRPDVAASIAAAAREVGLEVATAPTLEKLIQLARAQDPAAIMVHLGFDGRAGAAAAATLRSILPGAALVIYTDPIDASMVPAAEALGLGAFLVRSGSDGWPRSILRRLSCSAVAAACLRRSMTADRRRESSMLDLNAVLMDVQAALIRAALLTTPSIRAAARQLRLSEGTLRGKMKKLGIPAPGPPSSRR